MKKVIPILLICFSALCLLVGTAGLILVSTAVKVPQITPIGVAAAIAAFSAATLCGGLCALFKRDILCRIAFFISLAAFFFAVISIIIWLAAL